MSWIGKVFPIQHEVRDLSPFPRFGNALIHWEIGALPLSARNTSSRRWTERFTATASHLSNGVGGPLYKFNIFLK